MHRYFVLLYIQTSENQLDAIDYLDNGVLISQSKKVLFYNREYFERISNISSTCHAKVIELDHASVISVLDRVVITTLALNENATHKLLNSERQTVCIQVQPYTT